MSDSLESIFQFYLDNKEEFLEHYEGKFVLIKDEDVEVASSSKVELYNYGIKRFDLGTFLVQECSRTNDSITKIFDNNPAIETPKEINLKVDFLLLVEQQGIEIDQETLDKLNDVKQIVYFKVEPFWKFIEEEQLKSDCYIMIHLLPIDYKEHLIDKNEEIEPSITFHGYSTALKNAITKNIEDGDYPTHILELESANSRNNFSTN